MEFEVIKSYSGIKEGEIITPGKGANIKHMVEKGYWKEVKKRTKVEPVKREKKVEPVKRKRK